MGTSSANAAFVTYDVSFTADTFQVGSGIDPAPVDPVIGSFTITLDPSVAVANETAGITLNTLNIALGSALSYSFDPAAGVFPFVGTAFSVCAKHRVLNVFCQQDWPLGIERSSCTTNLVGLRMVPGGFLIRGHSPACACLWPTAVTE